jgi:hypothetical protein
MSNRIDNRLVMAAGACAVAVVLFGTTFVHAVTADRIDTAPVVPKPRTDAADAPAADVISMQAVNEAVAKDPFSPDRQPNATPYRLPTDPQEAAPPPPPPPPPALPAFRLVGTTQTPRGSIALIQVDNGTPKVVAVGETMNGFVLERIDRVSATMVQGDRRMDLQLQQPLPRSNGARPQNGRGQQPGRGQMDPAVIQKQMLQEMQELLQERGRAGRGGGAITIDGVPVRRLQQQGRDTTSPRNPRSDR